MINVSSLAHGMCAFDLENLDFKVHRVFSWCNFCTNHVNCVVYEIFQNGGYNGMKAYAFSKMANILFSNALARRLVESGMLHEGINYNRVREFVMYRRATASFLNVLKSVLTLSTMFV